MYLDKLYKILRYYHRSDTHHHHPHPEDNGPGITTKKSGTREIKVVRRVLDVNDKMADENRKVFAEKNIFVINVMSSPGSGKTTTLQKTLAHIMPEIKSAVIVGDICTTNDADRLAVSGAPVVQINTDEFGGDCHLAAHVIEKAAGGLDLEDIYVRRAVSLGVRLAINSDAHSVGGLDVMRFGIATARRGWAEAKDIVNTLPLDDLRALIG